MSGSVDIDLRGLPEVKRLLEQVSPRELTNRTRRGLRAGTKVVRQEMRREGATPGYPKGFRKTRTRNHQNPLGVSVSPKSPLSNIFEHGAKRHTIAPGVKVSVTGRKQVLAGPAGERHRARAFFAPFPVSHPGMAARPFIAPVFDASKDEATKAFQQTTFEGL